MAYTLTDDMKGWFAELAIITATNMNNKTTINDSDLDNIDTSFSTTPQASQVTAWKNWVKGGVRPANPH